MDHNMYQFVWLNPEDKQGIIDLDVDIDEQVDNMCYIHDIIASQSE